MRKTKGAMAAVAGFAIMAANSSFAVLSESLATEATSAVSEGTSTAQAAIPILGLLTLIGVGVAAWKRVK